MPRKNQLMAAPPFAVETALKTLGNHLRTARLRRNLSLGEMATKVGVERHSIAEAEAGKPGTAVATYIGILWALNLLPTLDGVADPLDDQEGLTLSGQTNRERARTSGGPSNAF